MISIYYALVYPYLHYCCILWGNNYEAPVSQLVKLQNKVVRVINNLPLRDHITPHYVNLGLIKLPDIVKLNTCHMIYDHFVDKKPSNFTLALVSEQHNHDTRSASLQHLNPSSFRINIRKFCPTVIGCYYWNDIPLSIREKTTKNWLKEHFSTIILLSINHRHTDSQMLHFFMCVCMCFSFFLSFEYFSYIFHSL